MQCVLQASASAAVHLVAGTLPGCCIVAVPAWVHAVIAACDHVVSRLHPASSHEPHDVAATTVLSVTAYKLWCAVGGVHSVFLCVTC